MKKGKVIIIILIVIFLLGVIGKLLYPYYQLDKSWKIIMENSGDISATVYFKDNEDKLIEQVGINAKKSPDMIWGTISNEKSVEFIWDMEDKLVFNIFSIFNYISEGFGSYVVELLEDKLGEMYISYDQLKDIGYVWDMRFTASDLGLIKHNIDNVSLSYCFSKPTFLINEEDEGMWFSLEEQVYLCLNSGTETVKYTLYTQDEGGVKKVEFKFYKNPYVENVDMPPTIKDETVSIIRQGYKLWKVLSKKNEDVLIRGNAEYDSSNNQKYD